MLRPRSRVRERRSPIRCSSSPQSDGFCSITGGYVVRDPGLPTLLGRYLYGDFCKGALRSVDLANAGVGRARLGLDRGQLDLLRRGLVRAALRDVAERVGVPTRGRRALGLPGARAAGHVAPDRRACSVAMRVSGVRSVRRLKRLSITLRTDEACRRPCGRIKGVAQFRTAALGDRREAQGAAGEAHGARRSASCAALRRNRRFPRAAGEAVDAAGNAHVTRAAGTRMMLRAAALAPGRAARRRRLPRLPSCRWRPRRLTFVGAPVGDTHRVFVVDQRAPSRLRRLHDGAAARA